MFGISISLFRLNTLHITKSACAVSRSKPRLKVILNVIFQHKFAGRFFFQQCTAYKINYFAYNKVVGVSRNK